MIDKVEDSKISLIKQHWFKVSVSILVAIIILYFSWGIWSDLQKISEKKCGIDVANSEQVPPPQNRVKPVPSFNPHATEPSPSCSAVRLNSEQIKELVIKKVAEGVERESGSNSTHKWLEILRNNKKAFSIITRKNEPEIKVGSWVIKEGDICVCYDEDCDVEASCRYLEKRKNDCNSWYYIDVKTKNEVVKVESWREITEEDLKMLSKVEKKTIEEDRLNTKDVKTSEFGCKLPKDLPTESLPKKKKSFKEWLEATKKEALTNGISEETINIAFQGVSPISKVIELDRRQAEYLTTFSKYFSSAISQERISKGRKMLNKYSALLAGLEKKYGVQKQILVALWAMESNFGSNMGSTKTISTLATLAHDGRRYEFFQNELRCALQIIQEEHILQKDMKSSWAGAMGKVQFMPSTFVHYAVDGDGDGKKDIWNSTPDALTSAANYLQSIGWHKQEPWGMEVRLPKDFDWYQARYTKKASLDYWHELGVKQANGDLLPEGNVDGAIILPSGKGGAGFLVHHNFTRIREWNRSMNYALAVVHLSDRLVKKRKLVAKAPKYEKSLSRKQVLSLQKNLKKLGFYDAKIDGMLGRLSHNAIRNYQRKHNLDADGYPSINLISKVRKAVRH